MEVPTDNGVFYWFFLHVLDDENTVLTLMQSNFLDKEYCGDLLKTTHKILAKGEEIYIGGHGDMTRDKKFQEDIHTFPGIGRFKDNGRFLEMGFIANEFGNCYQSHVGSEKPCPRGEFSIDKHKNAD
jgi:hypothetical protein